MGTPSQLACPNRPTKSRNPGVKGGVYISSHSLILYIFDRHVSEFTVHVLGLVSHNGAQVCGVLYLNVN